MNRKKWALLLLLCLMFQPEVWPQQTASQESAEDHLKRANEFAGSGNLRGAIGEFRGAIRLDPSNANTYWGLTVMMARRVPGPRRGLCYAIGS